MVMGCVGYSMETQRKTEGEKSKEEEKELGVESKNKEKIKGHASTETFKRRMEIQLKGEKFESGQKKNCLKLSGIKLVWEVNCLNLYDPIDTNQELCFIVFQE
ncbi:hypothetical protein PV325_002088 [Microctonus aethiopoides]|uniref:Uncharacterized protein n=1 Tax=Microctonus aethiopoides TaxID=144406 RepID=A0AA39FKH4_9HYME|nr:hypothetical protein PV325_002088 [Microctonus aethiopoides]KAK0171198.1 hypothetical protein PV328_008949 [Microctonus aethiopoides]